MLTISLTINQAKALLFDGALNLHMNSAREKEFGVGLDKARKKDFVLNKHEDNNDQILTFGKDGESSQR